jgi:APA family basic amino acid/polyamine antiporter
MHHPETSAQESARLPRVLGPTEALCVIVGSVIGSGIFLVPATVAKNVPYMGGIALVWVIGGIFSAAGALTLAELGGMLPRAGGPYVYLREAYGPLPAFLFVWAEFLVVRTGSMATLAAAFARYFAQVLPAPGGVNAVIWQAVAAVVAMATVAAVNVVGTRVGGRVQVIGTAVKVGALVTMIVLPFVMRRADPSRLTPVWPMSFDLGLLEGFMVAMVGVLWAYDGWVNVSQLAEEVREPGRNVPRALILGMAVLIALYLGMTLVYHLVLPMEEIMTAETEKGSERAVAADFCRQLLGGPGVLAISLIVMCSTFISLNGNALTGPRAYFAMARDGLFPAAICRVHPRFLTPANAIIAQSAWAILLTVAGTALIVSPPPNSASGLPGPILGAWTKLHKTPLYDVLYTYVIFGATIFYTLAISSVFVLRKTRPDLPRPYRTWGYPATPLLYIVAALFLMGSMLLQKPIESLTGLAIVAAGIPAYWFFSRSRAARDAGANP